MINDGDVPLVYLAISNTTLGDVVGYPDSKKIAAAAGPSFQSLWIRQINKAGDSLAYWDGEPDA